MQRISVGKELGKPGKQQEIPYYGVKKISLNSTKRIFYTGMESFLSYYCEIWTVDYRVKEKLLSTEVDFWRRAARTSKTLRVRSEGIRQKMRKTQRVLERLENNMLNWYGYVLCTEIGGGLGEY
jgi:hypothetical protein